MATGSAERAVTNTLTTTTADVITLTTAYLAVDITNHDATNNLYFRVDGVTAVGAADDNGVVLPTSSKVVAASVNANKQVVVSVVGNGNVYTIEGVN